MINHIVIQAGGKGTRLKHLTANKPKALVPVENLPMIFHLFRNFPDKRFIVIADYHREVLREYLEAFAEVKYQIVDAVGTGTCSGVRQAINLLPDNVPFMLIWSDLILPDSFKLPDINENCVGISETFPCRWSFKNDEFIEENSEQYGVAGLFTFIEKSVISDVPESGELVRWFKESGRKFIPVGLRGTREFGTLDEYAKLNIEKTRPFNKMTCDENVITKEAIDAQGNKLSVFERNWYEYAVQKGVTAIPAIYETEPLKMERISGKNIYEYSDFSREQKVIILQKIVEQLKQLHSHGYTPCDSFSIREAYYKKTMDRLLKVRDLIPFSQNRTIKINGRECRNIFFYKREFEKLLENLMCESFSFIHGDCTFSNLMLRHDSDPIFIDPRGYFGYTELFGDTNYDWAKLYYSIVGNYDRFNLKDFRLVINEASVDLVINSNLWEALEADFFRLSGADEQTIKTIHAVIWLSLTTYAWQDYDSICGAFYNGLSYLEELL